MASTLERPPVVPAPEPKPEPEVVAPWRNARVTRRVALLGGVLLIVFAALFLRLWALQVLSGTTYVQQAQANSFRTVPVLACTATANEARQPLRATVTGDQPELYFGLTELRCVGGDAYLARHRELATAAKREAVHSRDSRLR